MKDNVFLKATAVVRVSASLHRFLSSVSGRAEAAIKSQFGDVGLSINSYIWSLLCVFNKF